MVGLENILNELITRELFLHILPNKFFYMLIIII